MKKHADLLLTYFISIEIIALLNRGNFLTDFALVLIVQFKASFFTQAKQEGDVILQDIISG